MAYGVSPTLATTLFFIFKKTLSPEKAAGNFHA